MVQFKNCYYNNCNRFESNENLVLTFLGFLFLAHFLLKQNSWPAGLLTGNYEISGYLKRYLLAKFFEKNRLIDIILYIICAICAIFYIGISLQKLTKRIYQHNYNQNYLQQLQNVQIYSESFREREIERLVKTSALLKHSFDHNHYFDFNNVKVIDRQNNYYKLKFSEMIHIKNNECCNQRSDIEGLSTIYWGILDLIKNRYTNSNSNI